ncbi:MAG: ATPase [Methyloversatilis discipulorum]|uniref:BCAM0308 family protein n=1 Tax=Methyloversatilis discipulorum TaxID=1119528 RepID=UPI0026F28C3C|nr:BCAM0308 family protein [Methyloversatilis discipulorum]MBV5285560.1 ATPase [Methyloversatilis discipulorum]
MSGQSGVDGFRPVRRDQLRDQREDDPYASRHKPREPAFCPDCGAVFRNGRWQWQDLPPADAGASTCTACRRIRDRMPAGFVHVGGPYFAAHREELTALMRHREERERAQHPMERIIAIEPDGDGVLVTTTDIHLARDLGEALERACKGTLDYHYNEGQRLLRVFWRR